MMNKPFKNVIVFMMVYIFLLFVGLLSIIILTFLLWDTYFFNFGIYSTILRTSLLLTIVLFIIHPDRDN